MGQLIPIIVAALIVALIQVSLRSSYPEYATVLAVLFTTVVLLRVLGPLKDIIQLFTQLGQEAGSPVGISMCF